MILVCFGFSLASLGHICQEKGQGRGPKRCRGGATRTGRSLQILYRQRILCEPLNHETNEKKQKADTTISEAPDSLLCITTKTNDAVLA